MSTLDELRRANIQAQKASVNPPPVVVKKTEPDPPAPKAAPVQAAEIASLTPVNETVAPVTMTVAQAPIIVPEPVHARAGDGNGLQPVAEITHVSVESHANGIGSVPEITVTEEIELVSVVYSAPAVPSDLFEADIADAKKLSDFMERMRAGIAKKSVHASGVKVTVDMAPELFWRLKRYSRDHGNPSLRQICLELVIAFLDEEGY